MFYALNVLIRLALAVLLGGFAVMSVWFQPQLTEAVAYVEQHTTIDHVALAVAGFLSFLLLCDVIGLVFLDESEQNEENSERVSFVQRLLNTKGARYRVVRGLIKKEQWPDYISKMKARLGHDVKLVFVVEAPDQNDISHVTMQDTADKSTIQPRRRPFSTKHPRYRERLIKECKLQLFHELAKDVLGAELVEEQVKAEEETASA